MSWEGQIGNPLGFVQLRATIGKRKTQVRIEVKYTFNCVKIIKKGKEKEKEPSAC